MRHAIVCKQQIHPTKSSADSSSPLEDDDRYTILVDITYEDHYLDDTGSKDDYTENLL